MPYDEAKAKTLYARGASALSRRADGIYVVAADWCPDCKASMENTRYAEEVRGRRIYWINDGGNTSVHEKLEKMPGAAEVLGMREGYHPRGGAAVRGYNYPTVVSVNDGRITRVLGNDTISARGFDHMVPAGEPHTQKPRTEERKGKRDKKEGKEPHKPKRPGKGASLEDAEDAAAVLAQLERGNDEIGSGVAKMKTADKGPVVG